MVSRLVLTVGIILILIGLIYLQKPSYILAFWRRWHILSSGRFAGITGIIILLLGIGLLIYSKFF